MITAVVHTGAPCRSCGSPFRASEPSCAYCGAVRPAAVDDARVRHVVEAALREDRDHNGIPDVLEPRQVPGGMLVAAAPALPVARASAAGGVAVILAAVAGAAILFVVLLRSGTPRTVSRAPPATSPSVTIAPGTTDNAAPFLPAPPLSTVTTPLRPGAQVSPSPSPTPTPTPAPTTTAANAEPGGCVALRSARARNSPPATVRALEAQCRAQGGAPDAPHQLGF